MAIEVCLLKVKSLWIINYCYLIINSDQKAAVIIDPAWELETIKQALAAYQVNLVGILLTHHHFDHINLAEKLAKQYQAPVFMSQSEIDYYRFRCANLNPIAHFEVFLLNGISIKPIFTPGHTYGGTSYLIEDNLFSGDTLFIEGCGMCFGKGSDPNVLYDSLQTIKKSVTPQTKIYPGHSYGKIPGMPFQYLLENNLYLHFNQKDAFVEYRMRKNQKGLFNFK